FLIRRGWPPAQAEALTSLIRRYLPYAEAEQALLPSLRALDELARLERLKALRREHFAPDEVQALFAEQELLSEYMLRRQAILRDDSLSPTARQDALRRLDERMTQRESAP